MSSDIDQLLGGTAPDLQECFLIDGDAVRVTGRGDAFLRARFARIGVDVASIRSLKQLRDALERSFPAQCEAIAQWLEGNRERTLANRQLAAIMRGQYAEAERLWKLESKQRDTGLRGVDKA